VKMTSVRTKIPNVTHRRRSPKCSHNIVHCLNPYELIRKYRCAACKAIMMCACDEEFGSRFLSHQLRMGTELKSQKRRPVTHGFQQKICSVCRGLPAEPAPHDEGYGRASKIKRYYWRELWFETLRRQADWDGAHSGAGEVERAGEHKRIETEVLQSIKELHANNPKYVFNEPSQAEMIERYKVDIIDVEVPYVSNPQRGGIIEGERGAVSPEAFATRHFESHCWSVMSLESKPLHALFGVMMWAVIQDMNDPLVQMIGFAEKNAVDAGTKPGLVSTFLPSDSDLWSGNVEQPIHGRTSDLKRLCNVRWPHARSVLDDELLAESLRQPLTDQTKMSAPPPGAKPTTMRTGRTG
jgi:hypothetical protein